ncbi:putative N-acetyltransferase YhdJ [Saliniradius amylolyticus]|uniref:Putative N-acetyltransferase YhdJ n=1 Tax=Saliniradius amylolyticus TaxID=2183582 RepID=A0A2S2DZA9_9ALTE|nr:GNAT family N-acetyltransferase [Saliniradius amylolyticus]AWL10716.1 putative N-acetyltransferase YhdJ [Saliniradius amylolyticus]
MHVYFLENNDDLNGVLETLLQLRPQYNHQSLMEQIERQQAEGYRVVYVKQEGQVLAAAGFVMSEKLAWGKHIYIDDLVTCEQHRASGVGAFLINWFKDYARQHDCQQIRLDSGVQRFDAHKFYLREGFHIASHHFALTKL